jgi:hypothetical protein
MARKRKSGGKSKTKRARKSSRMSAAAKKGWARRRRNGTHKRKRAGHPRHWVKGHTTKRGVRVKGHYSHEMAAEPKKRKRGKARKRPAPCTPKIAARRSAGRKRRLQRALTRAEREAIKKGNASSKKIERLQKQLAAAEARKRARRHHRRPKHRTHHRKHHAHRARRHHVRAFNPIHGWGQGLSAFAGVGIGALLTILSDRVATSHALTATGGGSGYADAPAVGQLYNADAVAAPIWSSWKRLAVAGADIVVPFGLSMATKKHPKVQTFFQAWVIAAGAVVGGKALMDLVVKVPMFNRGPKGARLLAPEITSKNALQVAKAAALPAYPLTSGGTGPTPGGGTPNAPGANAAQPVPAPMLGDLAPGPVTQPGSMPAGPGFPTPPGGPTPNGSLECPPGMANVIPNGALPACASFVDPEDDPENGAPAGSTPATMVS